MALLAFFIERENVPNLGDFLPSYAATGNQTHVSRAAPHGGPIIQHALPTELRQPWQKKS